MVLDILRVEAEKIKIHEPIISSMPLQCSKSISRDQGAFLVAARDAPKLVRST